MASRDSCQAAEKEQREEVSDRESAKLCPKVTILQKNSDVMIGGSEEGVEKTEAFDDYGKSEYWDERYSRDGNSFDWLQRYAGLKSILRKTIDLNCKVLITGCGTSRLGQEMVEDGYTSITCIDSSEVVVQAMLQRNKNNAHLSYQVMTAQELQFEDGSLGAIIDKATIDSILCAEGCAGAVDAVLQEMSRVLSPGGKAIIVSWADQDHRASIMDKEKYGWRLEVEKLDKPRVTLVDWPESAFSCEHHFVYILTRHTSSIVQ